MRSKSTYHKHSFDCLFFIATVLSFQWNTTGITVAGASGGTASSAANRLSHPYGLALDSSNSLYIADYNNNRIQKWLINATNGTTVAGLANGTRGASSMFLNWTVGIALDSSDNMYFTDRDNQRVVFWANGASNGTTIAGITGRKERSSHLRTVGSGLRELNRCLTSFMPHT